MSDLDNMSEVTNENDQPVEVVETKTEETGSTPHADETDQVQFVIEEDEGDQSKEPNEEAELRKRRAAFAEQKRKKREAQELAAKERERAEKLEREIAELRQQVNAKPKPTFESCGYDEELFAEQLAEHLKSQPATAKPQATAQQDATYQPDDEAEFMLHEGEQTLKNGGIKDFDEKRGALSEAISQLGADPEQVFNQWASFARQDGSYDAANALYMVARSPKALEEIAKETSQLGVNLVLKKYASKLKLQKVKPVQDEPTDINHGGPIDNAASAIAKARQAWVNAKSPQEQAAKWKEFQAIKKGK